MTRNAEFHNFENIKSLQTYYNANQTAWITLNHFEDFVRKLNVKKL